MNITFAYINQLKQFGYLYSFSTIDILNEIAPENLQLPRTACTQTQYTALTSIGCKTLCGHFYKNGNIPAYAICVATIEQHNIVLV